ncbi:unnamed protein product [Gongylonema pulchrum]|uniref:Ras-associating domain-containing protein n=1 Tax=Gongylonema pulchrum TaxID=637853 RepID=A0A183DZC8_9BILA|nr:unnamed protein product [Gongylonema pulchrum]
MVFYMRTGSVNFDIATLGEMIQCALFFQMSDLSRLLETFLRQCSTNPTIALDCYKIVFQDERTMRCVTMETQQIVGRNLLHTIWSLMDEEFVKQNKSLKVYLLVNQPNMQQNLVVRT